MKTEPLTIRVDESLVNNLKEEARRLSYEKNKDVLYTDLIREAIEEFTAGSAKIRETMHLLSDSISSSQLIHRNRACSAFNDVVAGKTKDDWLSMFGLISNSLSDAVQEQVRPILDMLSLPRAIYTKEPYFPGQTYERDVCSVVYLISRRAGVPDQIQEGQSYSVPTFQIACAPGVFIDSILNRDTNSLTNLVLKSGASLAKEETANFCALLDYASMGREPIHVESITLDALSKGYDLLVTYGLTPKHLILSPTTFTKISQEAASRSGNWEFGALKMDNSAVGHYQDAVIRVTDRIYESESAYFVSEDAGHFIEKRRLTALIHPEPAKLRSTVAMWVEIGMSMSDISATCVTTRKKELSSNIRK